MRYLFPVWLVLTLAGCGSRQEKRVEADPFAITFGKTARWTEGREGFDPQLPGYHITGDIATIHLRPRSDRLPQSITLAIRTSPAMRPNLESFVLSTKENVIDTAPSNGTGLTDVKDPTGKTPWQPVARVKTGTYFRFAVRGKEVHVTFLPKAMELLKQECKVSWIDWYRE